MSQNESQALSYRAANALRIGHAQGKVDKKRSSKIATHACLGAVLVGLAALLDSLFWDQPKFLVALVLTWVTLRIVVLSRSLADPTVLMIAFASLYCAIPLIVAKPHSAETFYLPTLGAAWIYVLGTVGLLLGVAAGNKVMLPVPTARAQSGTLLFAGGLASVASAGLSLAFAAKHGIVGGDFSYAESFAIRAQTGVGILMLSVPLAGAAMCCTLCSGFRLTVTRLAIGFAPYFLLYLVHGQRKYLIFPFIFLAAAKLQVRNWRRVVIGILVAGAGFYIFQFLGHSRTLNYSFEQASSEQAIRGFIDAQGDAMGGEAVPVFATAAAAHEKLLAPLPYLGDYVLAPLMALPQFFVGRLFIPLNERFAFWWKPDRAGDGAGWGFSYFAEAYLIGGYLLVVCMSALTAIFFRWIYVRGMGASAIGLAASISLSMLPYVFWFQRNALAYLVREFGYQVIMLLLAYWTAKLVRRFLVPHPRSGGAVG